MPSPSLRAAFLSRAIVSALYVVCQAGGAYTFAILSVRLLGRNDLALWAAVEGWSLLLLPCATGGQEFNIFKNFASIDKSPSLAINGINILASFFVTAALFALYRPGDAWLVSLLLLSDMCMNLGLTVLRGLERYISMIVLVSARWGLAALMVLWAHHHHTIDTQTLVMARVIPALPVIGALAWLLGLRIRSQWNALTWPAFKGEILYSLPLIGVPLLNGGLLGLPRVILEHRGLLGELANLYVAQKMSSVFDLLFSRPLGLMWPQMRFKIFEGRTTLRLGKAYSGMLLASGVMMPVFLVLTYFVLLPIFRVSNADTGMVMKLILCNAAIILLNCGTMLSNVSLYARGKTTYMFYAAVMAMGMGAIALVSMPWLNVIGLNCIMVVANIINYALICWFSSLWYRWQPNTSELAISAFGVATLVGSTLFLL